MGQAKPVYTCSSQTKWAFSIANASWTMSWTLCRRWIGQLQEGMREGTCGLGTYYTDVIFMCLVRVDSYIYVKCI